MMQIPPSFSPPDARRRFALVALGAALIFSIRAVAAPSSSVTPELVEAARKEGKVIFYTSTDIQVAEGLAKAFEAKYPGIRAQVERTGAERVFQRVVQEYTSNIHAVDAVESTDIVHFIYWKRQGWLAAYVPEDVAHWPAAARDPDGFYAAPRATFSVIGYNTEQLKPENAPTSYADLLDAKWKGKIVKAHPGYSGNCLTATFVLSRLLGWEYFKQLSSQHIMQVQSANDPPKKLALGERQVMFDGTEYVTLLAKAKGAPVAIVYPSEGSPLVAGGSGVMRDAPHPNAARLFISFLFSREGQQLLVDKGHLRSFHPNIVEPADRVPLSRIKVLTTDPVEQDKASEQIKAKYAGYFGT
jgi:iron(III) transport system substrate-binding protein